MVFLAPSFGLIAFLPITTATLYTVIFAAPGPITEFHAYLTIPSVSNSKWPNGTHEIYTAVQPNNTVVAQLSISNKLIGISNIHTETWWFQPAWCCDTKNGGYTPPIGLYSEQRVYPANTLYNSYTQTNDGHLSLGWGDGSLADADPTPQASVDFFSSQHTGPHGLFSKAIFSLDISDTAQWDFGDVVWKSILITANTSSADTAWCEHPTQGVVGGGTTNARILRQEGQVTCMIDQLVMTLPAQTLS